MQVKKYRWREKEKYWCPKGKHTILFRAFVVWSKKKRLWLTKFIQKVAKSLPSTHFVKLPPSYYYYYYVQVFSYLRNGS